MLNLFVDYVIQDSQKKIQRRGERLFMGFEDELRRNRERIQKEIKMQLKYKNY
jgi:hypothetical protein